MLVILGGGVCGGYLILCSIWGAFGVLPKLGSQPHERGANVGSLFAWAKLPNTLGNKCYL